MPDETTVHLTLRLPEDVADQVGEIQKTDPEFLKRVVLYGITRRSIYRHLREQEEEERGS